MRKSLEDSIKNKHESLHPTAEQKVGPQVVKWLKENPGFEKRVAAKVTERHKLELKKGTQQRP